MIARINEFHAAEGRGEEVHARLASIVASIADAKGCVSAILLRSQSDPAEFVIYETWQSVAHHEAAAAVIPPDAVASTVALLAGRPSGRYFDVEAAAGA